jgi:hypothetical protein
MASILNRPNSEPFFGAVFWCLAPRNGHNTILRRGFSAQTMVPGWDDESLERWAIWEEIDLEKLLRSNVFVLCANKH